MTPFIMTVAPVVLAALITVQAPVAQQAPPAPPATEVFVAPLTMAGEKVSVGTPENISNSPGYDNQPFFAPDGRALFFTSARGSISSKCGSPQTDVYRFDLQDRAVARVTETPDCEYSPTVTPDGKHLSVIQVEPDGTQRLWRFTIDGTNPAVILSDVKPVGYHAWVNHKTVALFVLGQPPTLQIADTGTGKAEVAATTVGQSIHRMPDGGISFVQQPAEGAQEPPTIMRLSIENGKVVTKPLTAAVRGATQVHVAWAPDGTLFMAHEGALHAWKAGRDDWRRVADLAALGLRNVTRLAISPKADRIAIVGLK